MNLRHVNMPGQFQQSARLNALVLQGETEMVHYPVTGPHGFGIHHWRLAQLRLCGLNSSHSACSAGVQTWWHSQIGHLNQILVSYRTFHQSNPLCLCLVHYKDIRTAGRIRGRIFQTDCNFTGNRAIGQVIQGISAIPDALGLSVMGIHPGQIRRDLSSWMNIEGHRIVLPDLSRSPLPVIPHLLQSLHPIQSPDLGDR